MKTRKGILSIVICLGYTSLGHNIYARSYPITTIINASCSTNKLPCSYPLPRIENGDYLKYTSNRLYQETYSMLRGATYYGGRDIGMGGHQGTDIASASGTQVYAIADGEVTFAGSKGDRGNTITIKHIQDNNIIYSSYAHLASVNVKAGDKIKEHDPIGKVGSTGNSTGPHLHFQIEINQDDNHPFFYRNCAGKIREIVNEARCEKQMYANTTDPIMFIEKNGSIPLFLQTETDQSFAKKQSTIQKIYFSGREGGFLNIKEQATTHVYTNKNIQNQITPTILSNPIHLSYDTSIIKVIPNTFQIVKKNILILPKKTGVTSITFTQNKKIIKKIPIIIGDESIFEQLKKALSKNPGLLSGLTQG